MIENTDHQRPVGAPASPPLPSRSPASSLGAFGGDGRATGPSTQEAAWRERGRALYGVPEPVPTPMVLSIAEARQTVARRLRASLHSLSEVDRDAAIAAAARGYLDAHIERGHSVSAHRPAATPRQRPAEVAVTPDPPAPEAPMPLIAHGQHGHAPSRQRPAEVAVTPDPPAPEAPMPLIAHGQHGHAPSRRVRAPSSVGSVTFQVTLGHALAKGLAGGRVRITPGESAIDAIARRIVRDTRCAIVAMQDDGEELGSDGTRTLRNYRITLRGSDGTREVAGRDIEGVLWVRF
jgi:hypothetical protein